MSTTPTPSTQEVLPRRSSSGWEAQLELPGGTKKVLPLPQGIKSDNRHVRVVVVLRDRQFVAEPAPDKVTETCLIPYDDRTKIEIRVITTDWMGNSSVQKTLRPRAKREAVTPLPTRQAFVFTPQGDMVREVNRTEYPFEFELPSGNTLTWGRNREDPIEVSRVEDREIRRFPATSPVACRVHWPLTSGRIPAKIGKETKVEVFLTDGSGVIFPVETTWGELPATLREQELRVYPVCPVCSKWRVDTTRGFNTCGKCLTLDGYVGALLPYLRTLDPQVTVSPDPTGKSVQVRFQIEAVSRRFYRGYGFDWDNDASCLRAGKQNLGKVWDRLRPIPEESLNRARPVLQVFGLTLEVNTEETREAFVNGPWMDGLDADARKGLGIKGKKNKRVVHGVDDLDTFVDHLLDALCGADSKIEFPEGHGSIGFIPTTKPNSWVHRWWQ